MQRSNIDWLIHEDGTRGFSWNPLKGRCPNGCPWCYANQMRKRFKMYDGPLKLDYFELERPLRRKKSCTIFVCSMNELFGNWVGPNTWSILDRANRSPQHRFLFLTKFPQRMLAMSRLSIGPKDEMLYLSDDWARSPNWLGVTIARRMAVDQACSFADLSVIYPQTFISFEPLCEPRLEGYLTCKGNPDWLIIGSLNLNGRPVPPDKGGTRLEWVWPILERADKLGIPVFIKKELLRLYPELPERREVPWVKN